MGMSRVSQPDVTAAARRHGGDGYARWMLRSFGPECSHRQHCRNRCPALSKAIEHKSSIYEWA